MYADHSGRQRTLGARSDDIDLILKQHFTWLQVKVPKEAFCELRSQFKIGLPPHAVWNILIDPGNKRVFKNIKVNSMLML